ncbi:MAG: HEPN domain-containing protein [Bdellovibrionales bacterium]
MTNQTLADDYLRRAKGRVRAIEVLLEDGLYADVVREAQEACELALKAVIRKAGHSVPFSHEVSGTLTRIKADLPAPVANALDRLCEISKSMRRDRELAFYGSEDITPSEFYELSHARKALDELKEVLRIVG